jgi:hypothetical protein
MKKYVSNIERIILIRSWDVSPIRQVINNCYSGYILPCPADVLSKQKKEALLESWRVFDHFFESDTR